MPGHAQKPPYPNYGSPQGARLYILAMNDERVLYHAYGESPDGNAISLLHFGCVSRAG